MSKITSLLPNYQMDTTSKYRSENYQYEDEAFVIEYVYNTTATYTDRIHTPYNNSVNTSQGVYRKNLSDLFSIQDDSILTFISSNQELAVLLIDAYENIRLRFTTETLGLAFVDGISNKLEIAIYAPADDGTFLKFNEFNENWWFPKLDKENLTAYPFIVLNFWG